MCLLCFVCVLLFCVRVVVGVMFVILLFACYWGFIPCLFCLCCCVLVCELFLCAYVYCGCVC